jgi:hypothetical protein
MCLCWQVAHNAMSIYKSQFKFSFKHCGHKASDQQDFCKYKMAPNKWMAVEYENMEMNFNFTLQRTLNMSIMFHHSAFFLYLHNN